MLSRFPGRFSCHRKFRFWSRASTCYYNDAWVDNRATPARISGGGDDILMQPYTFFFSFSIESCTRPINSHIHLDDRQISCAELRLPILEFSMYIRNSLRLILCQNRPQTLRVNGWRRKYMYRRIAVAETSYLLQRLGYWLDYRRIGVQFSARTDIFLHSVQTRFQISQIAHLIRIRKESGVTVSSMMQCSTENTGNFTFIFRGNVKILEYYVYRWRDGKTNQTNMRRKYEEKGEGKRTGRKFRSS